MSNFDLTACGVGFPAALGSLTHLSTLHLGINDLTGPIPPELGRLSALSRLELRDNGLTGPIPPDLGNLSKLEGLNLHGNALDGPIPADLGRLSQLSSLRLGGNALDGPIPPGLGNLSKLQILDLGGNALNGPIPPELGKLSAMRHLTLELNALDGPIPPELGNLSQLVDLWLWDNGLTGPIPPELGGLPKLRRLELGNNSLSGPIPPELGRLSELTNLWLSGNALDGEIPSELGRLSVLSHLWLGGNSLSGPIPPELGNLPKLEMLNVGGNALNGPIPPELGNLPELDFLLLSWNELEGPIPPELGNLSKLRILGLASNRLTGRIPPELGGLHELERLDLSHNALNGPLPPELTDLGKVQVLILSRTGLCVPTTQAFRDWLAGVDVRGREDCEVVHTSHREVLKVLFEATGGDGWLVNTNWLSDAPLADWHGVTADSEDMVTAIALPRNGLSGILPLEIGFMATLREFLVNGNAALGGELPREMTYLTELTSAWLDGTNLCVPTTDRFRKWVAGVRDLRGAECPDDHGNEPEVATPISIGAAVEAELETAEDEDWFRIELGGRGTLSVVAEGNTIVSGELFDADGSLVGYDGSFGSFSIVRRLIPGTYYVRVVGGTEETRGTYELVSSFEPRAPGARAYLTQAVQSHDFTVPLVAGEDALLRVFVMADDGVTASMPPVRATFYQGGAEVHSVVIEGSSARVPHTMAEGDLDATANAVVPGSVIAPDTELVVEVDPDGTLDATLGIGGRIPAEGRMALDIREVPDFDVTAVPFLWTENPDSSGYKVAQELTADHELFYETRDWLPVAGMEVSVREPVLVDYDPTENMVRVLDDVALLHAAEGASGYYMGVPPWIDRGLLGIARLGSKVSVSRLDGHSIAHEFGHNLSLRHTPCGNPAGVDGRYPHVGGKIGAWGYDFTDGNLVDPEAFTDLMTYCRTDDWISDYSFAKAAEYRTGIAAAMASLAAGRVLVVRGGVEGGRLRIEPAFVLDAPPSLPERVGPYRLVGSDAQGGELFALRFGMQEITDIDVEGDGGFTFAIPVRPGWAETLATITLAGPEGAVTLAGDDPAAPATALVLDAATGRIRAILREGSLRQVADDGALFAVPGTLTVVSRGIPEAEMWRR